jgi:hypothetical protein
MTKQRQFRRCLVIYFYSIGTYENIITSKSLVRKKS